jgi:hypothetical protein
MGKSLQEFINLLDHEESLGLRDKLKPYQNANTLTDNGKGGRPTKNKGELTDSGERTQDLESNKNR